MFLTTTYNDEPSSIHPEVGVIKLKDIGFNYAILVDSNFSAIPDFYKACHKHNIKPIIGMSVENKGLKVSLIAKNQNGYFKICSLVSKEDFSVLELKNDNDVSLIVYDYLDESLLVDLFTTPNIYGGFGSNPDEKVMSRIKKIWESCPNDKLLPFVMPKYSSKNDIDSVRMLTAVKNKKPLRTIPSFIFSGLEIQNPLKKEIGGSVIDEAAPYLKKNILNFVENITDNYSFDNPHAPNFIHTKSVIEAEKKRSNQVLENLDSEESLLMHLALDGLNKRNIPIEILEKYKYKERLLNELNIMSSMGFSGYILIVWDIVNKMQSMDVPIGPGRGSGAGSLVLFALNITNIDPMPLGLLFERFLNPERSSMPDIDIDVAKEYRKVLIDYVSLRYNKENVAQIPAFDRFQAKSSIKDAVRVLDFPVACGEALCKHIEKDESLSDAYEARAEAIEKTIDYYSAYTVWAYALKIEGLVRNNSVHAAGFVISDEPIYKKNAVMSIGGVNTIHFDGKHTEFGGLIKFDFLSLKTLSIIKDTLELIQSRTKETLDFNSLPMDDPSVYSYISKHSLDGIFQLESPGMQDLCKKLSPRNYEDLISILSLYRPGVLGSDMLDVYIRRKQGIEEVSYFSEEFRSVLEPILKSTYGVILYQEQVMKIVSAVGGFSMAKADLVRRAMSKKDAKQLNSFAIEFSEGAVKKGFVRQHSLAVFKLIEQFAGYGFNKSHAAAYASIVYQTAYLKKNFPLEFMTSLLTHADDSTKRKKYLNDAFDLGLSILPPDINKSMVDFTITKDNSILYSLSAIKGLGRGSSLEIIKTRNNIKDDEKLLFLSNDLAKDTSEFLSFNDFMTRASKSNLNSEVILSLLKSGAFSSFPEDRKEMFLLSGHKVDTPDIPFKKEELLSQEKESLGMIVSDPLEKSREFLSDYKIPDFSDIKITQKKDRSFTYVFCLPISVEEKLNKRKKTFLSVELFYNHKTVKIFIHDQKTIDMFKYTLSGCKEGSETRPIEIKRPIVLGLERTLDRNGRSTWLNIASGFVNGKLTPLIFGPYPSIIKGVFDVKDIPSAYLEPIEEPIKKEGGEFLAKIK